MELQYKGEIILLDEEDIPKLLSSKWYISKAGYTKYIANKSYGRIIYFHRIILNYDGELEVDHIDKNGLNNQKNNLRIVCRSLNSYNKIRKNRTGFVGVREDKRDGKFYARITIHNKDVHLGTYSTPHEAAIVRDTASILVQGKHAHLNFPENRELYLKELS